MVPTPPIEPIVGPTASTSCVVDTDVSSNAMSRMVTLVLGSPSFSANTSSNGGSQKNVFYTNITRGKGRGDKISFQGQHRSSHGGHHQHEYQSHGGGRKNFRGKRSRGGCGGSHQGQQPNSNSNCYYYGKPGHMLKNCYQREHDERNGKLQQGNYASISNQGDEQLFMMQHMANSMIGGVSDNNVWYVDFGASNHMIIHG